MCPQPAAEDVPISDVWMWTTQFEDDYKALDDSYMPVIVSTCDDDFQSTLFNVAIDIERFSNVCTNTVSILRAGQVDFPFWDDSFYNALWRGNLFNLLFLAPHEAPSNGDMLHLFSPTPVPEPKALSSEPMALSPDAAVEAPDDSEAMEVDTESTPLATEPVEAVAEVVEL